MTQWIAAIARGHNSGVCLLKDGELVFSLEEERLSRNKYDGGPYASMVKILDYTDKIDYLVIAHTQSLSQAGTVDFSGEDIYTGLARKLGLIDQKADPHQHPQVIDLSRTHHKLHAACAFYRSGFESAVSLIVDGAGAALEATTRESVGEEAAGARAVDKGGAGGGGAAGGGGGAGAARGARARGLAGAPRPPAAPRGRRGRQARHVPEGVEGDGAPARVGEGGGGARGGRRGACQGGSDEPVGGRERRRDGGGDRRAPWWPWTWGCTRRMALRRAVGAALAALVGRTPRPYI